MLCHVCVRCAILSMQTNYKRSMKEAIIGQIQFIAVSKL